jgi:hypothetical protein
MAYKNVNRKPIVRPSRLIAIAALALVCVPVATPAFAGPNETAFLERLIGTWRGKGKITGAEAGNLTCRLTVKPAGERLNFNGRCAMSGGSSAQSFSGSIRYNEAKGVFESSSNGRTVAGKKSGSSLVFTTTHKDMRGTVTSTLTMSPSAFKMQFKMTESKSGDTSQGSIPFSKS